jgi:hypothetical protein
VMQHGGWWGMHTGVGGDCLGCEGNKLYHPSHRFLIRSTWGFVHQCGCAMMHAHAHANNMLGCPWMHAMRCLLLRVLQCTWGVEPFCSIQLWGCGDVHSWTFSMGVECCWLTRQPLHGQQAWADVHNMWRVR